MQPLDDRLPVERDPQNEEILAFLCQSHDMADVIVAEPEPQQKARALASVRQRLLVARRVQLAEESKRQPDLPLLQPSALGGPEKKTVRLSKLARKLNLVAAVLVVTAIIGGFLVIPSVYHPGGSASQPRTPIYFVTDEVKSVVYAVNSNDGSTIWQYDIGQKPVNQAVFSGGNLFFPAYNGKIYALRASDGQLLWQTRVASGGDNIPAGPIQAFGNLIFTGTTDGHLYALNAQTGAVAWNDHIPACPTDGSNPSEEVTQNGKHITAPGPCDVVSLGVYSGAVYGFAGDLYAWDTTNGHVLWRNTQYHFGAASMVISHHKIYLPTLLSTRIDVLDASDGHFLHTLVNLSATVTVLGMDANENAIYLAGSSLSAYRLSDDSLLWKVNKALGTLSVTNDRIYASDSYTSPHTWTSKNNLYALNAADGTQLWHIQNSATGYLYPLFEVNDSLIVVSNTSIYAVRASNGQQIWQNFPKKHIQEPVAGS